MGSIIKYTDPYTGKKLPKNYAYFFRLIQIEKKGGGNSSTSFQNWGDFLGELCSVIVRGIMGHRLFVTSNSHSRKFTP